MAGLDWHSPVCAEAEEPEIIAEYCSLWRGCLEDPSDRRATYLMTRRDLGGGYYEDVYSFKGRVPGIDGLHETTMRVRSYRGLFSIEGKTRTRTLYSAEEMRQEQYLQNDENQTTDFRWEERKYPGESIEAHFAQLMSGQRIGMKLSRRFRHGFAACKGPQRCDQMVNSRRYNENDYTREGIDIWIPVGEEELELPDGVVRTLVFDNFSQRFWYDPESEQIVRRSRLGFYDRYHVERLRLRAVSKSKAK